MRPTKTDQAISFSRTHLPAIQPNRYEAKQSARVSGVSAYEGDDSGLIRYIVRCEPNVYADAVLCDSTEGEHIFMYFNPMQFC